jgi:hypothetical protein
MTVVQLLQKAIMELRKSPDQQLEIWKKLKVEIDAIVSPKSAVTIDIKRVLSNPGQFDGKINMMRDIFDKKPQIEEADIRKLPIDDAIYICAQCVPPFKTLGQTKPEVLEEFIKKVFYG